MKKQKTLEEKVRDKYNEIWSNTDNITRSNEDLIQGWHFALYEKKIGVKTNKQAMINIYDYALRLINLKDKSDFKILDAGCGIGGALIYFAQKYPKIQYYGITLAENEIKYAEILKKQYNLPQINITQQSFLKTNFKENYFDRVIAIESVAYAENKEIMIKELNRILKTNGTITIFEFVNKKTLIYPIYEFIRKNVFNIDYGPEMFIDIFPKLMEDQGFEIIEIKDLIKSKNIKKKDIIKFVLQNSYSEVVPEKGFNTPDYQENSIFKNFLNIIKSYIKIILMALNFKLRYYYISAKKK